ncbi:MAG: tetratricopeptide repeat protein [Treponema sp.]|nr:tetratricopeptide repeat protein [Treponema sp.]
MANEKQEQKKLMVRRAAAAVMAHDFELAARIYKGLLKEDNDNSDLLRALGNVYIKAGDDEKALVYYEKINNLAPADFDALNSLGGIYRRLKQYEESIAVLKDALSLGKGSAQANYNLGFTYRAMERYDEAIDCFESVIADNPNDVLAYNHLGAIYAMRGEYQKAVAMYKRGLQIDPNHPILNVNLAQSCEALNNDSDAAVAYEAALRAKPGWLEAIYHYTDLLLRHGRTKTALDIVRKSTVLYPQNGKLRNLLGNVYAKQFDYENAAKAFEAARKINKNDISSLLALARIYEKMDRAKEALSLMKEAEALQSGNVTIEKQYAHVLLSADEYDNAGRKIKRVYDKNANDVETLDLCGQYYILKDSDRKADAYYKKINALDKSYREYEKEASSRYMQRGDINTAYSIIEKYAASHAKDAETLMQFARASELVGKKEEALKLYDDALKLDQSNALAQREFKRLQNDLPAAVHHDEVAFDDELAFEIPLDVADSDTVEQIKKPSEEHLTTNSDVFDFDMLGDSLIKADDEFDPFAILDGEDTLAENDENADGFDLLIPEQPIDRDARENPVGSDDDFFNGEAGVSQYADDTVSDTIDDMFDADTIETSFPLRSAPQQNQSMQQPDNMQPSEEALYQKQPFAQNAVRPFEKNRIDDVDSLPQHQLGADNFIGNEQIDSTLHFKQQPHLPYVDTDRIVAALDKANATSDYALAEAHRAYNAVQDAAEDAKAFMRASAEKVRADAEAAMRTAKQSIEQLKDDALRAREEAQDAAEEAKQSIEQLKDDALRAREEAQDAAEAKQSVAQLQDDTLHAHEEAQSDETKGLLALAKHVREVLNLD